MLAGLTIASCFGFSTFSEEADALLLENESTAGFICKQAIDDLDPTLMSDMQPKLDHLSTSGASIAIRTRAFDTCQTHSDFKVIPSSIAFACSHDV